MKGHFHDAIICTGPNLFNTCDRVEHTRKREMVSRVFSLKTVSSMILTFVSVPENCSDSGTNSLKVERKDFRVRKLRDGLEGMDGSGITPFLVNQLHPVCIQRKRIDPHLRGTLISRQTSLATPPLAPCLVCSRPQQMYP